jgi:hypothetical protein
MTDNNRLKRTLEFDLTDAPIIAHAFAIAATTAMMCGAPNAKQKMIRYMEIIKQVMPVEATWFDDQHWCEIGVALGTATGFLVTILPPKWDKDFPNPSKINMYKGGIISVVIGQKVWQDNRLCKHTLPGSSDVKALHDVLKEIAPMSCDAAYYDLNEYVRKGWAA